MKAIREFLKLESAGSVLLLIAAVLAMLIANSPLSPFYETFLQIPLEVKAGNFEIAKPFMNYTTPFITGISLKISWKH